MSEITLEQMMAGVVENLIHPNVSPILRTPDEVGLEYEEVFFDAADGVSLNGWFVPANSDKIVICNHFSPGNRYGYAGHLEPFNTSGGFEVNFLPKYKALHDAGYNVLAYDLRNHGLSASGSRGMMLGGAMEWRDVIGSLRYVRNRKETKGMKISLQSICLGANSTFTAIKEMPNEFDGVKSMIAIQPLSVKPMIERILDGAGIGEAGYESGSKIYADALKFKTGLKLEQADVTGLAQYAKLPVMLVQVKDDLMTKPYDMETIFANLPNPDKKLHWIEGTQLRFHGYTYFSEHPEIMIDWYNSH